MNAIYSTRIKAGAVLAALSLFLTGCFITPGKFDAELVLGKDGNFSFTYQGEIFFLGLSKLAMMDAQSAEFEAETCFDDTSYEERECNEEELAEQRAKWEEGALERQAKTEKEARQISQFLGGIDPTDPEASEELRQLLLRHKGWSKVASKGNGVFEIEYSASGHLSHDFMFPMIEDVPTTNIFVQAILRNDRQVRVNAPGFSSEGQSNPLSGLAAFGDADKAPEAMENMPAIDGNFTIRTDAQIQANNTDEGASRVGGMEVLVWKISPRTQAAPTALFKLGE